MTVENWHSEFNPAKFLGRVNLARLIERNEAYNESHVTDANSPCIFCGKRCARGLLLNDRSFLCQNCYSEVALISYPEKYGAVRRNFALTVEARKLAWEAFRRRYEHKSHESALIYLGWTSLVLAFANPAFIFLTIILLALGYYKNFINRQKTEEWSNRRSQWEQSNPAPKEPTLKHFHDPAAELTLKDRQILRIFNHWPGYPPFWKYLRSIVIERDSTRCQVTGCPSRLELHVHHMRPVANGGAHSPDNLVSLCQFHHALEPERGHERIWGDIKTSFFTLVSAHERNNRVDDGAHSVRAHLRRLQLISLDELRELTRTYGYSCPGCGETKIRFLLDGQKNKLRFECPSCQKAMVGPQELAEETGPRLAEVLSVIRNKGRWAARWDMLSEKKNATWGTWKGESVTAKRRERREQAETNSLAPNCPKCGSPMTVIKPRSRDKWKAFWGCTRYSTFGCRGSASLDPRKD